ncbi:autotransporter assembly complex protein TamA [Pseudaestuariivita rosea]|uniref:autotransporter assembly complex protein TamA n=1 Tax=Pseudaestuariivita rosea TaxID=2763263 RepID=UPI001ABB4674|nr:autotransporter assembly complex family protein [Pseudaestuariivita rosea]
MRTFLLILMLGALFAGAPAVAQEPPQVRFQIVSDDSDFQDLIVSASLVSAIRRDNSNAAQDYISAAQADYNRILAALYQEGYYGAVISIQLDGREAAEIAPLGAPDQVRVIVLRIDPGPRFRFGQTRISPLASDTDLPPEFARGQRARTTAIRDAAQASVEAWRNAGHAKAEPGGQSIVARHDERLLDVDIGMDPGPQLRFGSLIIQGNERVRTERIREIAALPGREVYSPQELAQVAERLRRTGTFRIVTLTEADEPNPDGTLDITAQVSEQKRRRLGYGIEAEADEGLALSAFWLHRNLLGGAERLRIDGEISGIGSDTDLDYRLGARFTRPAFRNPDMELYLEAELEQLNEPDFSTRQFQVGAGVNRYLRPNLQYSVGVAILGSRVEDDLGTRDQLFLLFPFDGEYDLRNDRFNPTAGSYVSAQITPYIGAQEGGTGGRLYGDGRIYRALGDTTVFAFRGQIGSILGSDAESTPAEFLFYSGGGGTVRGQGFQSLAVELGGGDRIGGRSFLGGAFELRQGITDQISLVGFYDVGYIGADSFPGDEGDWHSGAGLGLRYETGIGPIRLDIGVPVSGPEAESDFQVYIGIGQAF